VPLDVWYLLMVAITAPLRLFSPGCRRAAELRIDVLDQLLLTSRLRRMIGVIPAAALL
jgi:hypothetical protein